MRYAVVALGVLAGCDSPTPVVSRWNHATTEVGGMRFGVHWSGDAAEAYRTSTHFRPRGASVRANAAQAIEKVSGCKVKELGGDPAIITARLDCKGAVPPGPSIRVTPGDCYGTGEGYVVHGLKQVVAAVECDMTVTT